MVIEAIANEGRFEHLLLRNNSSATVDLSGWRVMDDDGTNLSIPPTDALVAGATLALCSGRGCVGAQQPSVTLTDENIWGNGGDAASLLDAGANEVSGYCYGNAC